MRNPSLSEYQTWERLDYTKQIFWRTTSNYPLMTKYTTGAEAPCKSSASHQARSLNLNEKNEVQTSKGKIIVDIV